jgi:release factor glutamine methyltransferase
MTLREWLQQGEARLLAGPHPERARLDAETLLLHSICRNRAWLLTHVDDEFGGCKSIGYGQQIERRLAGEPIQYITGECEFFGMPFLVNRDVLIPRPETEHLVERVSELAPLFVNPRVVDVGTGSGAIAIAITHEWPGARVTAIDISERALEVAKTNAKRLGFEQRIRFLQGDLLAPVAGEQFEFVISNPPYVAADDRTSLAVEVRDHEPEMALFAGSSGLDIYKRLAPAGYDALVPGGYAVFEIGYGQAAAVADLLAAAGFCDVQFTKDLQGIDRVISGRRGIAAAASR